MFYKNSNGIFKSLQLGLESHHNTEPSLCMTYF